ncbi:TetR/AcrR family transcriptional regulator [Amycolatopsis lurida]
MDTRDRLIESTRELLWERGYVGTSPKAIQQHAGAGQGSMYHHFAGKPELALAAIERTAEDLRANAHAELSGPGKASERITAYVRRERDMVRGCPIGRLTQDPDVVGSPELRRPVEETFDWLRNRLAEVITEGQADGEFAGLDPRDTAATVIATLQGGYVLALASGSPEGFDRAVEGVLNLLVRRP